LANLHGALEVATISELLPAPFDRSFL
jgi:hypothetical protein